ncbi:MAG: serine/threonine protein kinase [Lentisphaeraceae bacterium]|nr:serine/threonine protein kinase [Lentisphaeraceae bacterium]
MSKDSIKVRKIGKYILQRQIGYGSMGTVWYSHHMGLDLPVAVKLLKGTLVNEDPEYVERFIQEGNLAGKVNHKNIVRIYDAGNQGNTYYMVMEYINGGNILELIGECGQISSDDVIDYAITLTDALIEAHSLGVVHRDIKPENIMLTKDGKIKLADLGLAKSLKDDYGSTMTGVAIGTPNYISPEQVRNGKYADQRSDIYSLGATLYHMVTGQVPFVGESSVDVMMKHCNDTLVPPEKLISDLPKGLNKIICKMMEKLPEDRYQSAEELLEAFNLLKYKDATLTKTVTGKTQINIKGVNLEEIRSRSKNKQKDAKPSKSKVSMKIAMLITALALIPSIYFFPKEKTSDKKSLNIVNTEVIDLKKKTEVRLNKPDIDKTKVLNIIDASTVVEKTSKDNAKLINLIGNLNIYKNVEDNYRISDKMLKISKTRNKSSAICLSKKTFENFSIMMQYRILKDDSRFRLLVYKNKRKSVELTISKRGKVFPTGSLLINNLTAEKIEGDYTRKTLKNSSMELLKLNTPNEALADNSVWQRVFIIKNYKNIKIFINGELVAKLMVDMESPSFVGFETWHSCEAEIRQLILKEI